MSAIAQATDEPILLRHDEGGIAHLTLNRPNQFNSLSSEMLETLFATLDAIAAEPAVRVVVIGGAGKAFCAGHDLKEMRANQQTKRYQTGVGNRVNPIFAHVGIVVTIVKFSDLAERIFPGGLALHPVNHLFYRLVQAAARRRPAAQRRRRI